jgi:hypothetical protein
MYQACGTCTLYGTTQEKDRVDKAKAAADKAAKKADGEGGADKDGSKDAEPAKDSDAAKPASKDAPHSNGNL